MQRDYDVEVEWKPFEVHPEFPAEGKPVDAEPNPHMKMMRQHLRQLADEIGWPLVRATRIPNTRLSLEAAEFARAKGKYAEYHRELFKAYFADGRNIGDREVLAGLAPWVDLDADELSAALENHTYAGTVQEEMDAAKEMGITAVPTFLIGNQAIVGVQPYEVFQTVMSSQINK